MYLSTHVCLMAAYLNVLTDLEEKVNSTPKVILYQCRMYARVHATKTQHLIGCVLDGFDNTCYNSLRQHKQK